MTAEQRAADVSDSVMAERVASELLRGRFRWSPGLGWLNWDGRRWARIPDERATEAVRAWGRGLCKTLVDGIATGRTTAEMVKAHTVLLTLTKIRAIVTLARGMQGVLTDPAEFDRYGSFLNVGNGIVDLTNGNIVPHHPDWLLTKIAPVDYHPGARHDAWDKALRAIPADCLQWAQLRYGQAITGEPPPDDLLIVQQGSGENGKTTFSGAVAEALGDYYQLIPDRVILGNPQDHPTELMTLRGARFGLIEETPEARRLTVSRLKKVVGTPEITARLIRQDSVTFRATHSLFLSTNYRPLIEETDHGTWRRLALLRFPYTFGGQGADDPPVDRHLRQAVKSAAVLPAALAWLIEGAIAWYAAGQQGALPARIVADTRGWRSETDVVMSYMDERIVFDPDAHVIAADLVSDFGAWLASKNARPWSDKLVASRFEDHSEIRDNGVEKRRTRFVPGLSRPGPVGAWPPPQAPVPDQYRGWFGMRFRTAADPVPTGAPSAGGRVSAP